MILDKDRISINTEEENCEVVEIIDVNDYEKIAIEAFQELSVMNLSDVSIKKGNNLAAHVCEREDFKKLLHKLFFVLINKPKKLTPESYEKIMEVFLKNGFLEVVLDTLESQNVEFRNMVIQITTKLSEVDWMVELLEPRVLPHLIIAFTKEIENEQYLARMIELFGRFIELKPSLVLTLVSTSFYDILLQKCVKFSLRPLQYHKAVSKLFQKIACVCVTKVYSKIVKFFILRIFPVMFSERDYVSDFWALVSLVPFVRTCKFYKFNEQYFKGILLKLNYMLRRENNSMGMLDEMCLIINGIELSQYVRERLNTAERAITSK
uniref:Fanconi anemia group D2 protein n=1 Tax=Rhabditophanes sp. KR3021 TaxID=114890 RepID=A0AC35TRC3_9BILA